MRVSPFFLAFLFSFAFFLKTSDAKRGVALVGAGELSGALQKSLESKRVFAGDLTTGETGIVLSLNTGEKLASGRYRLHLPLSLAPYADGLCRDVSIKVNAAGTEQTFTLADLSDKDQAQVKTFEFPVNKRADGNVEVSWQLGERGRMLRLQNLGRQEIKLPDALEKKDDGLDILDLLEETEPDGSVLLSEATLYPFRLIARYPVIEKISPVGVTEIRTDKVLYEPNQKGSLAVKLKNFSARKASFELKVLLHSGLGKTTEVYRRKLEAGTSEQTIDIPFVAPARWGAEAEAVITYNGKEESWSTYLGATDNFWEMGIGHAYPIFTQGDRGQKMIQSVPTQLRSKYTNWLDLFFWAPCDWSRLTPASKVWWGGQTSYPHDEANLQTFIQALQENGIRVSAYVSRNAAGPHGWETARQHPEWFGGGRFSGRYNVEYLDNYNDPEWRAKQEELDIGWYGVKVDLTQVEPLDYGIDQIIKSVDHYGWDAVRFDGHYTTGFDAISTRNMRRLKERVLAAYPEFRLGYNWGRAPEWRGGFNHELREAMAGGGMYMQEGIREWAYTRDRYWSWSQYAQNEMRIAKRIKSLGGSYHCILDLQGELSNAQRYYKLVHSLICGAHPAYGTHYAVPGSPSWGAFMTRWSELIWHPHLKLVSDPEKRLQVGTEKVLWKPFLQESVLAPDRKRVVAHLLNPPTQDGIQKGQLPSPLEQSFSLKLKLKEGEVFQQALLVTPDQEPFARPLDAKSKGRDISVEVTRVQHWAMVVVELAGSFAVPAEPPSFTEQPDLAGLPGGEGKVLVADPNKEDVSSGISPAEGFERLLDSGSVNIGNPMVDDPDSPLGIVQGRRKDQARARMGKWWLGAPAGGYEVYLRVKWTDDKGTPTPQHLNTQISATLSNPVWHRTTLVTPGYPEPPEGAIVMKAKGAYHDYKIADIDRWWDGSFRFLTDASTHKPGDNQIFQERVIFKRVRTFSDQDLQEHGTKVPKKPAGLRKLQGTAPEKVFVNAGMFWKIYLQDAPFQYELGYSLPKTFEELYQYDAIVLANTNCGGMGTRKMLQDYVSDGGRLVLLGGNHALKYNGHANTFLESSLPFQLLEEDAVEQLAKPTPLGLSKSSPAEGNPLLFWKHLVQPHKEATVLAWAGEDPVSLRREVGKGMITVFTGTPLGSASQGQTPFWKTDFWKKHLTTLVKE